MVQKVDEAAQSNGRSQWTEAEDALVRQHPNLTYKEIALKTGRSYSAVASRAAVLREKEASLAPEGVGLTCYELGQPQTLAECLQIEREPVPEISVPDLGPAQAWEPDPEIAAMEVTLHALTGLDARARERVLRWLRERFEE